ncbi:hypothetical protein AYO46_00960 [Betaproteobacteria bacterium SCGC AG-212-J23]|nr:hypothetical protein AYO46_00960 [Betaproteobacteria bacterium SCGC AG-212-J23]
MLVLPLPIEPEEPPVGAGVVELGDLAGALVPPLEDLLKCASHSAREIWPSLLVSTEEKLGGMALSELLPVPADGDDGEAADGETEDGLLDEVEESAATASVERAKSAAAVVTVTLLSI